jgi:glycosyltransferase involved in cell wall biosynthesis
MVHTEEAMLIFTFVALLAGIPRLVLTVHNAFQFTGKLRARKIIERAIVRLAGGRFGFVSDAVEANELRRFHNPGVRITNWVDTLRFRPASSAEREQARKELAIGGTALAILTVGNCNAAKNHGTLITALQLLPSRENVIYLHVGQEEPDAPERTLASELGVAPRVRFAGSQEDVLPWLWAADLFAMPSKHEGLAIAPLEAIASGCPALLASVDGLEEISRATHHVLMAAPEPAAFAKAISELFDIPASLRRERARSDSSKLRAAFSPQAGVEMICRRLYGLESEGSAEQILAGINSSSSRL